MSHSRRKTPIIGIGGKSEKFDKIIMHRKLRRITKNLLKNIEELDNIIFPIKNEVMDKWDMAKDGKYYISKKDKWYEKVIRK
jgi:hypothetical protein